MDEIQAALQAERKRVEQQLGITSASDDMASVARAARAAAAKRKRDDVQSEEPPQPLRRSTRASQPVIPFAPTGLVGADERLDGAARGDVSSASAPSRVPPVTGSLRPESAPQHGSLREYDARVAWMTQTYLGKLVPGTIAGGNSFKASVIFESCARPEASSSSGGGASMPRPKFNKYAGLQQYRNAFILFINIGVVSESGFTNAFSSDGATINWYAADSMHEQTPAILRLRHHATGHTYEPDVGGDGKTVKLAPADVALVCRLPGAEYVWCGEVELQALDEGSRPLAFTWRLRHAEALRQAPAFQALLKAQG